MNHKKNAKISVIIIMLATILVFGLSLYAIASFNKSNNSKNSQDKNTYEIAFICNDNNLSESDVLDNIDKAAKNASSVLNKSYKIYYTKSVDSYTDTIDEAVTNGALVVICPDNSFEDAIYSVQSNYVNTYFIILNGIPHNIDNTDSTIAYNVIPIDFNDGETGFIAGYTSVIEGYKHMSFLSIKDNVTSLHYAYGFLQGANYAAKGNNISDIDIDFYITNDTKDSINNSISSIANSDSNLIVTCSDSLVRKVVDSTKDTDKKVIGCNIDSKIDGNNIIAKANENTYTAIYSTLSCFFSDQILGGSTITYDATKLGISFEYNHDMYKNLTQDKYNYIYTQIVNDKIKVISDTTISTDDLGLTSLRKLNIISK